MASSEGLAGDWAKKKPDTARVVILLLAVIFVKPVSNLFLAWGMKHFPQTMSSDPGMYLRAVVDPLVALGIGMQVVWLLMRMALLSVADLSFVLPVTAVGYVISTVLAKVFLHEAVSRERWIGTCLIFLGTALVSFTVPRGAAE
jgi:uncharacterized membrane protein